jgi:3-hydroxyisobutyrate dehydrogenase-like beta-hydroxyacid dehydrogenase
VRSSDVTVGFIGLGHQGTPMARRIAEAAIPIIVWARRREVMTQASAWGARGAVSPAALGAACDIVCVCVFDAAGVEEVLFGSDGVVGSAAPGTVVLVHTTMSPSEIRRIAQRAARNDIIVLDAPVSGGPQAAEAGELLVLLGGPDAAAQRVRPVVETYAGRVIRFAEAGSAQLAKLLNNGLLAAQVALVADAVRLGRQAGLGDELFDVLRTGSARGFAVELLAGIGSIAQLARSQFAPTIGKDVRLLVDVTEPGSTMVDLAVDLTRQLNAEGVATA